MRSMRRPGLCLAFLALLTLSCQAVTGLVAPQATVTPPREAAIAATPTPAGEAELAATSTPAHAAPTEAPLASPTPVSSTHSEPPTPTLGTASETKSAIESSSANALEQLAAEAYTPEDFMQMDKTFQYTIDLTSDEPALWSYGWCATTSAILQDNLKHITPRFLMNDIPVAISRFYTFTSRTTDSQSGKTLQCQSYAMLVSHWPQGTTSLQTIATFDALVNDGLNDYPAGTQTFDYTVTLP